MNQRSIITPFDLEYMLCDETAKPQALPLSLLKTITDDFSDEQEIGRGGFAVVYKGKLPSRTVAVKKIFNTHTYEKEYQREIQCLVMAKHKNVVRFLGYCADTQGSIEEYDGNFVMADVQQRLLCFEYLPNGSLHEYINDMSQGFRWTDRYRIIMGICRGLHHLHQKNILHLDLKPANILLDDNWEPKITDFGISRCFDQIQSQVITKIAGTNGYLPPEYFYSSKVSYRLDIFSLGVVIIEILTGKRDYPDIDHVVESWSEKVEKSQIDVQLKQVRVCAEIATDCYDSNPAKRPNTQQIINMLSKHIETDAITKHQAEIDPNELHQDMADTQGEPNSEDTSVWLRYQKLNTRTRRCIEYCSIFPRGYQLRKDKLVCQWIAQDYVKNSAATQEMEDVAEGYIQELISWSFLKYVQHDIFEVHSGVHEFLESVASKCCRIENGQNEPEEWWTRYIPWDVQHIFVRSYAVNLITEKICGLEYLSTLIIEDAPIIPPSDIETDPIILSSEVQFIESICKRLPKLRVLSIQFKEEYDSSTILPIPESISQLKNLRYLAFMRAQFSTVILPRTLNELQHILLLDFSGCQRVSYDSYIDMVTLWHIFSDEVDFPNISRLTLLQTIPMFRVRNEQGYEVKQLRDLNNLHGTLVILGLENIKSKEEALEANLSAKERLTELKLCWETGSIGKIQEEVLEGLCPPTGLRELVIWGYSGLRFPDWMIGKQNAGPKDLDILRLRSCSQPGVLVPQLGDAFIKLRELNLSFCGWDTLPGNIELLTSLKKLTIFHCENMRYLPTMPGSLEMIWISGCNHKFTRTCKTAGHSNWEKIKHITKRDIGYEHEQPERKLLKVVGSHLLKAVKSTWKFWCEDF